MSRWRTLYLVKRGPRSEHHNAPFHPVVVTHYRKAARSEAGWTGDRAWVWEREQASTASGWLLTRWDGLDIDYGHVGRGCTLPDGTHAGFAHERDEEPWTLLDGAVWWSPFPMPERWSELGIVYPPDRFTQQRILDFFADDGSSGFGRDRPPHWPEPLGREVQEVYDEARIPNRARVSFPRWGIETGGYGFVEGLKRSRELPNGNWVDVYLVTMSDGAQRKPSRSYLERENPDLVVQP